MASTRHLFRFLRGSAWIGGSPTKSSRSAWREGAASLGDTRGDLTYRRLCRLVDVDDDFDGLAWGRVGEDLAAAMGAWRGEHPTLFVRFLSGDEGARDVLYTRLGQVVDNYRLIVEEAQKLEEAGKDPLGMAARALDGRPG